MAARGLVQQAHGRLAELPLLGTQVCVSGTADQVLKRLMDDNAQRGIDHIIFSGDATALGFANELEHAAEALQVKTRAGLAVPGNHDYCTVPAAASGSILNASSRPWQEGQRIGQETYPFAQRVGGRLAIIGVNTQQPAIAGPGTRAAPPKSHSANGSDNF